MENNSKYHTVQIITANKNSNTRAPISTSQTSATLKLTEHEKMFAHTAQSSHEIIPVVSQKAQVLIIININ